MRFIGDVHAKFDDYKTIAEEVPASIQVGDFGAGFRPIPDMKPTHRFIRGNHDNPEVCHNHPNWIKDGHHEEDMFFLGGGYSIDHRDRTNGVDWWSDEQLSYGELFSLMDVYESVKPRVLITHECPSNVVHALFEGPRGKIYQISRTSNAIGSLIGIHKPEIVIFGHWHQDRDRVINGVRYICLGKLSHIDL